MGAATLNRQGWQAGTSTAARHATAAANCANRSPGRSCVSRQRIDIGRSPSCDTYRAVARHPPSNKFPQFDRVRPANARHCVVARHGTPSQDVNLLIAMILAEMLDGPGDDRGGADPSGRGKPARPDAAKD